MADTSQSAIEVIAHRGLGQGFVQPEAPPENTLPAFAAAWSENVDACELDCHMTSDGELIVIHDPTTNRTTHVKGWQVSEHTLAELKTLDAGSWKGAQWAGVQLPTLAEVLAIIPRGKRQFVEIKPGPQVVPEMGRVVRAANKQPEQIVFISFNLDSSKAAKQILPEHKCYLLVEFAADYATGQWLAGYRVGRGEGEVIKVPANLDRLIAIAREANLDGLDVSFNQPLALAQKIREAGLEWIVWTVNEADLARSIAGHGVSSITTDKPVLIRNALAAAGIPTGPRN